MAAPLTLYSNIAPELYRSAPTSPIQHDSRAPSLWEVYRKIKEPEPSSPVQSAVIGLRHNAEAAAIGALFGFIKGEFGSLDIAKKYPVDGIAAALLYAVSVRDSTKPDGLPSDFRAMSSHCTAILFYRKMDEWREKSKASAKDTQVHGRSTSVDPITEAGKRLFKQEEK